MVLQMGLVVVIWCYPCPVLPLFLFLEDVLSDFWYRWVYYNGMDNAEWKLNMEDMQEGTHPQKEKKSVAGQFTGVKYRSETYWWTQKLNSEDYGVDKYWVNPNPVLVGWVYFIFL